MVVTVLDDGAVRFARTHDPTWAEGPPGHAFVPLSDARWASARSAPLTPTPRLSFDLGGAFSRIRAGGEGSEDATEEAAYGLVEGCRGDWSAPVHQTGGYLHDGHEGAQAAAAGRRIEGRTDPDGWHVLLALRSGGAGVDVGDANTLAVMIHEKDLSARRWDRTVSLLV